MREWLDAITEPVIVLIDALALVVVVIGTAEAALRVARGVWKPLGQAQARDIFLRYARWLVAALTFQLAADILETSISTSWQTIARVGAVAVIRTFLNYFLDRDLEKQQSSPAPPPA